MRKMWTRIAAALLVGLAAAACGQGSSAPDTITIAVIPKGTAHIFWQSIHAGAARAAKELDVEIIWRGPVREDDRDSQVSEVEGFVGRGVSGIVLAPLDETALMGPVSEAKARNIPVVIIDSGLRGSDFISFVATDNQKGGELGGDRLAEAMGGKGKVVLLRYAEGSDSTNRRETGFLASMKKHRGIEVVSDNQYLGSDVEGAYKRSEAVLSRFKNRRRIASGQRHFLPERIDDVRHDARAAGQRLGRQGQAGRVRRRAQSRRRSRHGQSSTGSCFRIP